MRNPEEIEINGKKLSDIIALHDKWRVSDADGQRANLKGAYLEGAYLKGAYLEGANLYGANLEGAYLKGANLEGANLEGAYLKGANLEGANLYGANLEGANLRGAKDIIAIGPIGSRGDFIFAVKHEEVIMIKAGCFWGTLADFKNAVKKTHNDNQYAQAYAAAIVFIRKYFTVKED